MQVGRLSTLLRLAAMAGLLVPATPAPGLGATAQVAAQGNILHVSLAEASVSPAGEVQMTSPRGALRMTALPRSTGDSSVLWDLDVRSADGDRAVLKEIEASAFFLSDLPCLIALVRQEANSVPGVVRVYDIRGSIVHEAKMVAPTSPALSPDGTTLAWREPDRLQALDLRTLATRAHPALDLFALGASGRIVGVPRDDDQLRVLEPSGPGYSIPLAAGTAAQVRKLALSLDGTAAFLLLPSALLRVELRSGVLTTLFEAPAFTELRDVSIEPGEIAVGMRRIEPNRFVGSMAVLDTQGGIRAIVPGGEQTVPRPLQRELDAGIPWPIAPDAQHPIGNSYGEYQNYGGGSYPHPGIDVLGSPGQPVFAVRGGVVKAILTTSGVWHWRVAVADSASSSTTPGYLYAHLDAPTIAVNVGDTVAAGEYLGNLVQWPVANFTHCHFTRIEDSGTTWDGEWLSVQNPHLDLTHQSDAEPPFFEPALAKDLLAFCQNETSNYLDPSQIAGAVDVIAHVGDRIASTWVCAVQELRYSIYHVAAPEHPVVNDKLAQYFDMTCDTYGSGTIDALLMDLLFKDDATCDTEGDYDSREFFHIITNSDGDGVYEPSDLNESWDTTQLPDGDYVVKVVAIDAFGNATADSMVVTTANGNTTGIGEIPAVGSTQAQVLLAPVSPNPARDEARIRFHLSAPDRITLALYDVTGRRIQLLADGWTESGDHALRWNPSHQMGSSAVPGVYFLHLRGERLGTVSRKVVIAP